MCVALCALLLPALCAGFSRAPAAFGPAQRSHANAQRAPVAMRAPSRADDVDDDDDDDDDARPPFNFDRSVELASLAFHTYVPVTDGKWERGSDQTNVAFQRASFVSECYDGVLIVNLKRVRGLPKDAQQAGAGEALLTGGALDPYVQLSIVEGRKVPGRDDADAAARDVFRSETRWRMGEGDADAAGAAGGAAARPPGGGAAKARPREQGVAEYDETAYLYVNDLATARLRVTLKDQNVAKEDDLLGAASLGLGGLGLDGGGGAAAERAERVVIKYSAPIGPGMAGGAAAGALFGGPLGAGLGAAAGALGKRWMRDATVEVSLRYLRLGEAAAAVGGLSEAAQAAITASALQLSKADEQELIERALAKAQAAFRAARAGGVSADAAAAAAAPVAPAGVAGAVPARASESSAPAGIDWAQLGKAALRAERSEADGGAGVAADDASAEGGGGGSAEAAAAAKLALSADEEEDMIARAVARAQAAYLAARGESAPKATPVAPPAAARPSAAASPALATASLPQPAAAPFNPDALGGTAGIDWTELGTAAVNPRRFELIAYIDNADTDTQVCAHARARAATRACIWPRSPSASHTHTRTHAHVRARAHTHAHAHTHNTHAAHTQRAHASRSGAGIRRFRARCCRARCFRAQAARALDAHPHIPNPSPHAPAPARAPRLIPRSSNSFPSFQTKHKRHNRRRSGATPRLESLCSRSAAPSRRRGRTCSSTRWCCSSPGRSAAPTPAPPRSTRACTRDLKRRGRPSRRGCASCSPARSARAPPTPARARARCAARAGRSTAPATRSAVRSRPSPRSSWASRRSLLKRSASTRTARRASAMPTSARSSIPTCPRPSGS
jgi:hypothetical protein